MAALHLVDLDPELTLEERLAPVVERERLTSRIGLRIGIGQVLVGLVLLVLGATGIESDNVMLQVFMGGPVLNPTVSVGSVVSSLFAVVMAGLLASLYPAAVALRIQPVTAMNSN